ncbi:hypothetical protein C6H66_17620 [Photorhabdus hindustanensis]|uniref:Uncharacterized protein n=1 Tax=Photorhabdus hindustanensis TaxID=2918802 RepID=A0A2S8PXT6_9GAMM|nr:hypothetical protein [Photorhabdus hainanensis]PQQ23883.1 hypothetical protein C6H66_17620 [Photorhabdus hindustanensis]
MEFNILNSPLAGLNNRSRSHFILSIQTRKSSHPKPLSLLFPARVMLPEQKDDISKISKLINKASAEIQAVKPSI